MKNRSIRRRRSPAALLAVPAVATMVWGASNAAFTSSTETGANSFAAGTVTLTDNDSDALLFDIDDMVPGDQHIRCIDVSYQGNLFELDPVKLYGSLTTNVGDYATNLDLKVEALPSETAITFGNCPALTGATEVYNGSLASFTTNHTNYANGATGETEWTPTDTIRHAGYRFTVTLNTATGNDAQGDSATALFTWEVQSAPE